VFVPQTETKKGQKKGQLCSSKTEARQEEIPGMSRKEEKTKERMRQKNVRA
jgi:hypothetical protein